MIFQLKKKEKITQISFKRSIKNYFIDKKSQRLMKQIIYRNKDKKPIIKNFFIAYINEKINIIKYLHEMTIHKGITTLYKLILKQNFIWYGIYEDVKNYIKNCVICQETHKNIYKKPKIKSIISNYPKERYVMDLVSIDKRVDDEYHRYKYIFNIVDHFSKYLGSYLIENKTAKEVLYCLNDFIIKHGKCDILQCDNGREFSINLIINYCSEKDIKLIHSSPYHPQTNGVVERIHQSVIKSLITLKIKYKKKYDLKMAIVEAENAHNSSIHTTTKEIPKELFNNNNKEIYTGVKNNIIEVNKNINNNSNPIKINSYVLLSNIYIKKGNKLDVNFKNIGTKNIPALVVDNNLSNSYKIKILIDMGDLKKNEIYLVNYKLIKESSKNICEKLILENDMNNNKKIIKNNNINNLVKLKDIENKEMLDNNNNRDNIEKNNIILDKKDDIQFINSLDNNLNNNLLNDSNLSKTEINV